MKTQTAMLIAALCLGGGGASALAPAARAAGPATKPAAIAVNSPETDAQVRELIIKLGDSSADVRKDASAKLSAMGKAALPALKALEDTDDPELRARVRALVRRAERRLPPAAPKSDKRFQSQSMKVSVRDGQRIIDVNDNGYQIRIERSGKQGDERIKMSVTGIEDGKEVTEVYEAKDAEELKRDNPEAFAIYEKWGGGAGGSVNIRIGGAAVEGGAAWGGAVGIGGAPGDGLNRVREMLQRQIAEGNLPAEQQLMLQEHINRLDEMQREMDKRMDEVRKRLPPAPPGPPLPPGPPGPPPDADRPPEAPPAPPAPPVPGE